MRKEIIGDAILYLGDCLEIMEGLGPVDAVVTDPPYGIGFQYESHNDSPEEYEKLIAPVVQNILRLCPEGPCFIWQSMNNAGKWHRWFPPNYRIFAACKSFTQIRPVMAQYAWDPVIFWGMGKTTRKESIRDWHVQSSVNFGGGRISINHPCPRPIEQVTYIVEGIPAQTILDPFMGSGTTGVACSNLGRKFIGIEIEERYFDIACRRIEQAQAQIKMDLGESPKPEQTSLEVSP